MIQSPLKENKIGSGLNNWDGIYLQHPCLRLPGARSCSLEGQETLFSLGNIDGEKEAVSALTAMLSSLAFLERVGWPFVPEAEGWRLDEGKMPVWTGKRSSGQEPSKAICRTLEHFLAAACGGRRGKGIASIALPKRYRHRGKLAEWFSGNLKSGDRCPTSAWQILQSLLMLCKEIHLRPGLEPEYGLGLVWKWAGWQAPGRGVKALSVRDKYSRSAILNILAGGGSGRAKWKLIDVGGAPPYPLAALEPIVRASLGGAAEASEWFRQKIGRRVSDPGGLANALGQLMARQSSPGWLICPAESLDAASREALESIAQRSDYDLVLLGSDGEQPPIELQGLHALWLPGVASRWYLEHLAELYGPDPSSWLLPLDLLSPDEPGPGSSLIPPMSSTNHITAPQKGRARRNGKGESCDARCANSWYTGNFPELATGSLRTGDEALDRFWAGAANLYLGQPDLALAYWEGLGSHAAISSRLPLYRARAYERRGEYSLAFNEVRSADIGKMPEWDRNWPEILEGQFMWLKGDMAGGRRKLEEVISKDWPPDEKVQAGCHLATLHMNAGGVENALARLAEARCGLENCRQPLSEFLVSHRSGLLSKKMGDYTRAIEHFKKAAEIASDHFFRWLEAAAICDSGNALRMLSRHDEAESAYASSEEGASGLGLESLAESARFDRAICMMERGALLKAQRLFEISALCARRDRSPLFSAIDSFWMGQVYLQRGLYPEALGWAEKGLEALRGIQSPEIRLPLALLRAEILLLSGQTEKAERAIESASPLVESSPENDDLLRLLTLRLQSTAGRGRREVDSNLLEKGRRLLPLSSPADRCGWLIAESACAPDGGAKSLAEALTMSRKAENPYLEAKVLHQMSISGTMPHLSESDMKRVGSYLRANAVRGPEVALAKLFSRLQSPPEAKPPAQERTTDAELLLEIAAGRCGAVEELMERAGIACACIADPGATPRWFGDREHADRAEIVEAIKGDCPSGSRLAKAYCHIGGRSGRNLYFIREPRGEGIGTGGRMLMELFAIVFPPEPPRAIESSKSCIHPAVLAIVNTRSEEMVPVLESISRAALFNFPALITGEPGVGKEVCARAIHAASGQKRAFIAANCANLSPTLAASLLFGHKRGSFTGAERDQHGLVEAARGGTLFLDEVGELPVETQAQLLRFLQDGTYTPLGETRTLSSDCRVVAATNRDLESSVAKGSFRADLFHRLNVVRLEIPPLRSRPDDIPLLFGLFLESAAKDQKIKAPDVEPSILERLSSYIWPGNVRELQNLAKSLLVASHGEKTMGCRHLPPRMKSGQPSVGPGRTLAEKLSCAEGEIISQALVSEGWNLAMAARTLGISRQTLAYKTKRLGIRRPDSDRKGGRGLTTG